MDWNLPTVRLSPSFDTRYKFDLACQCHWSEVNQHPVADVMPVLLKGGQSASREEAVEEMKDYWSMKQHWYRSTVMPERGPSIFQDRLKPRSHTKLPKYPWTTRNPIYVFLSHCCWQPAFYYPIILFSLRYGEKINYTSEIDGTPLFLSLISYLLYYSDYDLCYCFYVWVIILLDLGISWAWCQTDNQLGLLDYL